MGDFQFGRVKMLVEPDTTGFKAKLRAETAAASEGVEAKVDVVPDMTGFNAALRRRLKESMKEAGIDVTVPVNLKIDQTQLKTDVRFIQAQLDAQHVTLEVGINVPRAAIQTELRRVREVIKAESDVEVTLKPVILKKDIQAAIRDLKTLAKAEDFELPIRPTLDANKTRFVAEVRSFIAEIQRSIPDLHIGVKADTGSAIATRQALSKSLGDGRDIDHIDDKLKKLAVTAGAITGPLGGAGAQFARLTQSGSLLAAGIGGLGVAFAGIIGYGAKIAADAQLADKGIVALTKSIGFSTDQSVAFIKQLEKFASVTPFEVPQVKEATKFLLGAGTAAEDILPTLQRITDVGAVLGSTTENIENVAKALAKVRGKGTAQLLELNQIRRNLPGFDPVKAIADFKGQSLAETYTQISKKAIPAELAITAINKGLAEFPGAAGAAAAAAETLSGRFSTLKDNVALGFKNAFLQPEVEKPLNDLLKRLADNAQAQIATGAKALAPIITAFGPALENGVQLFLELTKASAPFFVKLLEGAATLETKLIPAVHDLAGPFGAFGDALKLALPLIGSIISLLASGVSVFGLTSAALKLIAPLITTIAGVIDSLPEPLRVVLGLFILLNRQKIFDSITKSGPEALGVLKQVGTFLQKLASSELDHLIMRLDAFAKGSKSAGDTAAAAFRETTAAAEAAAAATAAATASSSTALATISAVQFQQARVRAPGLPAAPQGAIGSGIEQLALPAQRSIGTGAIDVASFEKLAAIGPGAAAAITDVGEASVVAATKTGFFTSGLRTLAGGASTALSKVGSFFKALASPAGLTGVTLVLASIAAIYSQIQKSAEGATRAGEQFSAGISAELNDASKNKFSLADVYLGQLTDKTSEIGKIFANDAFTEALKGRGEKINQYADRLSKDSKSAAKSYFDLALAAQGNRSLAEKTFDFFTGNDTSRKGLKLTSSDTEQGLKDLQKAQRAGIDILTNASGKGSDIVKQTLAETQKSLIEQGKFQYKASLDAAGNLDLVKTKEADYNLTVQATNEKLKEQGISVDGTTGKVTVYNQALVDLAQATGLSLDETDAFKKTIDSLGDSITKTYDSIRGTDVLGGSSGLTAQLGGASLAILDVINSGGDLTSGLAALTQEMGLSGDAAADFLTKATAFGTAAIAEIQATQEAFKGLIPTASSVFDELKAKADDVLPSYDDLLKGLQQKLTESATFNDNLAKIIARGGTGIIDTLKGLPAEAQAQYAAAIAAADDKTFVGLEAKSRELADEGQHQIQVQGVLAVATVQTAVEATLQPIAAAQAVLEKTAAEVRAKLTGQAQQAGLTPQQRRALREDRNATTGASVASGADVPALVAQTTDAINTSLATVPIAAQKASTDAVKALVPLPQQITAATVPGLQTWSSSVQDTSDQAAGAFDSLAIRGVSAFDALAAGIEAPAQRVLQIVGTIADAINSVVTQVGATAKIQVPHILSGPKRPNVDSKIGVHHDGGIIGAPSTLRNLNSPLASNEALVVAQKGEGVIPADAMKRLGLPQFKFIRDGDIDGLIAAKNKVPGARKTVEDARSLSPGILGGMGPVLAGAVDGALGQLTKNVDKYISEVSTLIDAKLGATPGLFAGNIGGAGSAAAAGWIRAAMALAGAPDSWFNGLMTLAKRESGFNPRAINLWDSNAKAGHPSIGLMQTIGPTFRAYALPGHTDIYNPIDNAIASIRYIRARYGDISRVQQANASKPPKGYAYGDLITTEQIARVGEGGLKELILPVQRDPRRAEDLLAKYLFDPIVSNVDPDRLLDRLERAAERRGSRRSDGVPAVNVAEGGSLLTVVATGLSPETAAAQTRGQLPEMIRRLLSP